MRFFKIISIIITMLFSSVSYTETFDKNTIKTIIENEFGKDYTPALPGVVKRFPNKFYKDAQLYQYDSFKNNKVYVNDLKRREQKFYYFIEQLYFLKTCSLLGIAPTKTNPINFSRVLYKGLLISNNVSFINDLSTCNNQSDSEKCIISKIEEVTNYYTEHYKKTVKYYKLLQLLDPEGKVITGYFSYPSIKSMCEIEPHSSKRTLKNFKTFIKQTEKSLLELGKPNNK